MEGKNEWRGTGGKENNPGFLICEEYSDLCCAGGSVRSRGWVSHRESRGVASRGQQHSRIQEVFGVSWVALRLCLWPQLGPHFCLNLVNLSRT